MKFSTFFNHVVFVKATLIALVLTMSNVHAVGEDDILGNWKLVDFNSGATKVVGKFFKEKNGSYSFKVTEVTKNYRGKKVVQSCQGCPGKYNNLPLKNLKLISGLSAKNHDYLKGKGIDPWIKKAYLADLTLNDAKNMIKIRKSYNADGSKLNFGRTYYLIRL